MQAVPVKVEKKSDAIDSMINTLKKLLIKVIEIKQNKMNLHEELSDMVQRNESLQKENVG